MADLRLSARNYGSFVGRATELARLDSLLQSMLNAQGQVCFIAGEPGAGKTALVQEFTRRAQERHPELIIAFGDCSATSATSDAYLPFREILALLTGDVEASLAEGAITAENASRLRSLVGRAGDIVADYGGDLIDVFVPGAALVTKLGRQLARRFSEGGSGRNAAQSTSLDDPARVLQQFTNVVRKLAEASPLVLVIDDVHWADRASLDLLFHLSRRIEGSRLLLLATYRSNEIAGTPAGDRHPLEPVLNEVHRYYGDTTIDLDGDAVADRLAFVNRLIDSEPNELPASFREELLQHTDGHPLFTVELLQALRERGSLARSAEGSWRLVDAVDWDLLPRRSEGVIAERLGRLPDQVRDLLSIAAVEGEQFTAQVVARVAELDSRAVLRSLSGIAERQHQLVHAQGVQKLGDERVATYRFRHELFRAYLYDSLDPVERSELHFSVACALEALHAADLQEIAPVLADHFERAAEIARAVAYLDRAADAALRRFAPRQAAELWQRALVLGADALPSTERFRLLEQRGSALRSAGAFDDATATLTHAYELADTPLARSRLLRKLGGTLVDQHHLTDALSYLARARETLPIDSGDDSVAREAVQLFIDRAWASYWLDSGMEEVLAEGATHLDRHGSTDDHARWLQMQLLARLRAERYRPSHETIELAGRQLAAARAGTQGTALAHCAFLHGFVHLWYGDLATAEQTLTAGLHAARKHAHGLVNVFAQTYLTVLHRRRGHVDAVLAAADLAEAAARESGMAGYIAAAQANRAWACYRRDDLGPAAQLTQALELWQQQAGVKYPFVWLAAWPLAAIRLEQGQAREALTALEATLAPGQQPPPAGVADAAAAARVALDHGDDGAAAAQIERALAAVRAAGEL